MARLYGCSRNIAKNPITNKQLTHNLGHLARRPRGLHNAADVDEFVGDWARQLEKLVAVDEEERNVAHRRAQARRRGAEIAVEYRLLKNLSERENSEAPFSRN